MCKLRRSNRQQAWECRGDRFADFCRISGVLFDLAAKAPKSMNWSKEIGDHASGNDGLRYILTGLVG
jgi:hypothetical protein